MTPFKPWTLDNKATRAVYEMSQRVHPSGCEITQKDTFLVQAKNCMVRFHQDGSFYAVDKNDHPISQAYVIVPPSKYITKSIMKNLKDHNVALIEGETQSALRALTPLRMRFDGLDDVLATANKIWQHLGVVHNLVLTIPQFSIRMNIDGDITLDMVESKPYSDLWKINMGRDDTVKLLICATQDAIKTMLGDRRCLSWRSHYGHPLLKSGHVGSLISIKPRLLPAATAHEKMMFFKSFPSLRTLL